MLSPSAIVVRELPAVDDRLAPAETRYEVDDGKLVYVSPADIPHGSCHANLASLVLAHVAPEYMVAADLLTRTSLTHDIAPDVSVLPRAPHPLTGGRQLEALAFEVVSQTRMARATRRAGQLSNRGVRVFAIDVKRALVLEWSREREDWAPLDPGEVIADPALAIPLPVAVLVRTVRLEQGSNSDVAQALVARGEPVITALTAQVRADALAEGHARALLKLLELRGSRPAPEEHARILAERDLERLDRWSARALTCAAVAEIFDDE